MITSICLSPAIDKIFLVDDFEPGKMHRVKNIIKSAGGKGINVARVAAALGEEVACIGFKAGNSGDWIVEELDSLGVVTEFTDVQGETRTNINIIDKKRGNETELLEPGPVILKNNMFSFLKVFSAYLCNTGVLVCSGGIPEGVPEDFYRTLIELTKQYKLKVILDSSNVMLEEGIRAKPYMIKPNLRELRMLSGQKLESSGEILGVCREIVAAGVSVVVASMGNEGALYVYDKGCLHSPALDIEVVNTIGSGDSMVAGLAVGLSRELNDVDTFKLGMACAAANAQFTEIGYINKLEVNELLEKVIINN